MTRIGRLLNKILIRAEKQVHKIEENIQSKRINKT